MNMFTHLHCHSQFSVNDGLCKVEDLVDRAKQLGFKYLALTDHGRMGGIPRMAVRSQEPDEEGRTLEAICGCEIYICDGDMLVKESVDREISGIVKKRRPKHYHATMLCINKTGYENLINITNIGYITGFYYESRVDLPVVEKYSEGILATSGCISGMIPQAILKDDFKRVDFLLDFWRSVFKDNFYLEVQYHGIEAQLKIAKAVIELSKKHKIPMIATNDVHYLNPSDKKAHDLLKSMRMNSTENTGKGYPTGEFYLKSAREMYDVWEEYPEVCKNTIEVAEKCAFRFPTKTPWEYPIFSLPKIEKFEDWKEKYMPYHGEYQAYLQYICLKGLKKYGFDKNQEHKDRLKYELSKIFEMSVEEYFLILWDVFRFCEKNNISRGCGRGSGVGSLVLFLMEITAINPLDEDMKLMFERFLNPGRSSQYDFNIPEFPIELWERKDYQGKLRKLIDDELSAPTNESLFRECFPNIIREILPLENQELDSYIYDALNSNIRCGKNDSNSWILYYFGIAPKPTDKLKVIKMGSLPDVDSDFDPNRRDDVIQYIKDKYGEDHVINIGTYGQYRARAALKETLKASGYSFEDANEISKIIPFNHTLSEALELDIFQSMIQRYKVSPSIIQNAIKIEGSAFSNVSEHASGVVIAPTSLENKVPMHRSRESIVSQYDMTDIEKAGYIKFDFLGLSNVGKMAICNQHIEKRFGKQIDFRKIHRNDPKTLSIFAQGKTETIFQFASDGIKNALKDVGVDSFNDLVAVNALYRPGPMKYISKRMYERFKSKDDPNWHFGMTYAENKQNPQNIEYIHPDLEPILEKTYNILVFQEQAMSISQKFGGFTLQEADVMRKAIGKKLGSLFEQCKLKFFEGSKKNGYDDKIVFSIWKMMEDFASYSFNQAHSASYALIGYWNAYLLANFPLEWYSASINEDVDKEDRYTRYLKEAKYMGIPIFRPDVNKSTMQCYVDYETTSIILPLNIIKGVGKNAIEVVNNQPFENFKDFCFKVKPDKKLFEKLLQAGALKLFGSSLDLVREYQNARDAWQEDKKTNYISETQTEDVMQLFGKDWGQSVEMKDKNE